MHEKHKSTSINATPQNGKRLSAFRRNQTKEIALKKVITLLMSAASCDNVEKKLK
jgi:hypothetical protein